VRELKEAKNNANNRSWNPINLKIIGNKNVFIAIYIFCGQI